MKPPKHLAMVGLSPADSAQIAAYVRGGYAELDHDWAPTSDDGEADAILVDLADFGGRCARIRALDEGRHLIVLAANGSEVLDAKLVLDHPIVAKALIGMLNYVGNAEAPRPRRLSDIDVQGEPPRVDPKPAHKPQGNAAAQPVAENRANFIDIEYQRPCTDLDALLRKGAVLIERAGMPRLFVDPVTGMFHTTARLAELEPYFLQPLETSEFKRVAGLQLGALQKEAPGRPLARLRWLNALLRSNGWLATHLDPGAHFRLKQWLELDHDYRKQHRIGLALMRSEQLQVIARTTKSRMQEVFDVVNAYDAIGLIEARRNPLPAERAGTTGRSRGKLGGILSNSLLAR